MNLSALRPFNKEAAQKGEPVCWSHSAEPLVEIFFIKDRIIPVSEEAYSNDFSLIACYKIEHAQKHLRMAPLCWIEEKPVYKDDVLWYRTSKFAIKVTGYNKRIRDESGLEGIIVEADENHLLGEDTWAPITTWTWHAPKRTRHGFLNCYPSGATHLFFSKEDADLYANSDRSKCIPITWEV